MRIRWAFVKAKLKIRTLVLLTAILALGLAGALVVYRQHTAGFSEVRAATEEICQLIAAGEDRSLTDLSSLNGETYYVQGLINRRDALRQGYSIDVGHNGLNGEKWGNSDITHLAQIRLHHMDKVTLCFQWDAATKELKVINAGYFSITTGVNQGR